MLVRKISRNKQNESKKIERNASNKIEQIVSKQN